MKELWKKMSVMLITTALVALIAVPAFAANTGYVPLKSPDVQFYKYLLVDSNAVAPNASFTFTISSNDVIEIIPGSAATTTSAGTLPLYKGPGKPTISAVSFSPTDTVETPTLVSGYKTYKQTVTIDMSSVEFSEPGVYRYYITEDTGTAGMFYDVDATTPNLTTNGSLKRTLDVYVEDTEDASSMTLKVTGFVMYDGVVTAAPPAGEPLTANSAITTSQTAITVNTANGAEVSGATKTNSYVNYYTSYSLTVGKVVTGNQGSRDKYFKLTLTLNSPVATTLTVDVSHADIQLPASDALNKATNSSYAGKTNPQEIKLDAGKAKETEFYLQHGQYIIVEGLVVGTTYDLKEEAEGYTSTEGITAAVSVINWDGINGNDALADAVNGTVKLLDADDTTTDDGDLQTGYTNDKNGVIPTGVLVSATPVIIIAIVVVAGVVLFIVMSAKRKASEAADTDSEE